MANKPLLMCHLSVSLVPNLGKTTWSPQKRFNSKNMFPLFLALLRLSWLFVFVGQQYIWNSVPAGFWYQLLQSFQSNGWIWFDTRSRSHWRYRWLSMYPIFLGWLWHLLVEKWIKWFYFDSGCNKSLQFEKLLQFSSTTYILFPFSI